MYHKLSEKLKKVRKGVALIIKLDVIKCIWYDLVGYLGGLGILEKFPYKLMVTVSLLYAILTSERFHRNTLLVHSRGNLYSYISVKNRKKKRNYITLYTSLKPPLPSR